MNAGSTNSPIVFLWFLVLKKNILHDSLTFDLSTGLVSNPSVCNRQPRPLADMARGLWEDSLSPLSPDREHMWTENK